MFIVAQAMSDAQQRMAGVNSFVRRDSCYVTRTSHAARITVQCSSCHL